MTITSNQPDMYVTFRDHIRHGNVWTAEVELGMQDTLDEPAYPLWIVAVSYTHLRAHETPEHRVWRLLL